MSIIIVNLFEKKLAQHLASVIVSSMKTDLASKIKRLKPSEGFVVKEKKERDEALREAKTLKRFGQIDFDVTTREIEGGGWKVIAV